VKKLVSLAVERKQGELANELNSKENQRPIFRTVKQMAKERQEITGCSCLKDSSVRIPPKSLHAGSVVVRIDPLHFLAGYCKR